MKNVFVQYSKNVDFSDHEEQKMVEKDGKFSASLSALQWNTTYYIRYAAKNSYSSAVTKKVSQAKTLEATVPTINIEQISNVLDKTASVRVALVFDGGVAVSEYGVCLNSNATPTVDGYHVVANNEQTTISLSGLKENTTYRMRAYAKNEIGVGYSKQFSFTTLDLPKVRTDEFSDIQLFSVRLHATAVSTGNDATATFGFCWAEQTNPTIENNSTKVAVDKDTFSYLLSNLKDETTYYVRAYAQNKIGLTYGEEKSFMTQPVVIPTVITSSATNISYKSATVGGNVTGDGGAAVTERGIVYSKTQNPTTSSSKMKISGGIGNFSVTLTTLSSGTTYYVRAYAINEEGTSYGEQKSFTTKACPLPIVTTSSVTNITCTSATVGGNVTSDDEATITERGVVYANRDNPTYTGYPKKICGSGPGSFSCSLSIKGGKTYYVRAYAMNIVGSIAYGESISFKTISSPNGHDYVDLGLSVKWATCNVGATKPEEYGDYFAWGETTSKTTYNWSTYKWCNGSYNTMTKYCDTWAYGYVDYKTVLDSEDDAASVNMGGSWRMPTKKELEELIDECTWTWTTLNGVNGYHVEGPNGNSIFLPAAGYRWSNSFAGDAFSGGGEDGLYWSISMDADELDYEANSLFFDSGNVNVIEGGVVPETAPSLSNERANGLSVRGVFE